MKTWKTWSFPSFQEWKEREYQWEETIGGYTCCAEILFRGDKSHNYMIALAEGYHPTNIHTRKIAFCQEAFVHGDERLLKMWYEESCAEIQESWKQYLQRELLRERMQQDIRTGQTVYVPRLFFGQEEQLEYQVEDVFWSEDSVTRKRRLSVIVVPFGNSGDGRKPKRYHVDMEEVFTDRADALGEVYRMRSLLSFWLFEKRRDLPEQVGEDELI